MTDDMTADKKKGFVLYHSFKDIIEPLDWEQRGKLFTAIMNYASKEDLPQMDTATQIAFIAIRGQMDRDAEKYNLRCQKNRMNGKLGGRPTKEKPNGFTENPNKPNGYFENPKNPMKEEGSKKQEEEVGSRMKDEDVGSKKKDEEIENITVSKDTVRQTDVQRIVEEWNSLAEYGIAQISRINCSSKRYKGLVARIKEYGIDKVLEAIDNIRHSSFLQGKIDSKKQWVITFDWFVLPNNFPKVLEGNYADKGSTGSSFYDMWRDA